MANRGTDQIPNASTPDTANLVHTAKSVVVDLRSQDSNFNFLLQ